MTKIQELRNEIYHNYSVDVDEMDAHKVGNLIDALDELQGVLEEHERKLNSMRHDLIDAIHEIAEKYQDDFDTIYLFGNDVESIENDDIDVDD